MTKYKQISVYEVEDYLKQDKFVVLADFNERKVTDIRDMTLKDWINVKMDSDGSYVLVVAEGGEEESK